MRRELAISTALICLVTRAGLAQQIDMDMHDMAMDGAHMTMTPHWPEQPGDRARADSIVQIARSAVRKYADVSAAEADGFKRFAPQIKHQRVYHYTSTSAAIKARVRFDAAAPTSLLYQEQANGDLKLVGVMYTMPASASFDQLNARIPLSIAQWHQHTNICLPPRGDEAEATMVRQARFGIRGTIASESDCREAGGRWVPRMFGWMVHVNLFASNPSEVWQASHGGMRHQ